MRLLLAMVGLKPAVVVERRMENMGEPNKKKIYIKNTYKMSETTS
jgi:hypothetical protein